MAGVRGMIPEVNFCNCGEGEQKQREPMLQAGLSFAKDHGPSRMEMLEADIASLSERLRKAIRLRDKLREDPEAEELLSLASEMGLR